MEWLFPKNDCNSAFSFREVVPKASQEAPGLWKCVEEGIDPSLSDAVLAVEEGLDRLICNVLRNVAI